MGEGPFQEGEFVDDRSRRIAKVGPITEEKPSSGLKFMSPSGILLCQVHDFLDPGGGSSDINVDAG